MTNKEFMEENYVGFQPIYDMGLCNFVATIFPNAIETPEARCINNWETLFEYWEKDEQFYNHTQSDIIQIAEECEVEEDDVYLILNLPQVVKLERG